MRIEITVNFFPSTKVSIKYWKCQNVRFTIFNGFIRFRMARTQIIFRKCLFVPVFMCLKVAQTLQLYYFKNFSSEFHGFFHLFA